MHFEVEIMNEVFTKFHVRGLSVDGVFHIFKGLDGATPHDHPYSFRAFILTGGYIEKQYILMEGGYTVKIFHRKPGDSFEVLASTIHQIIEFPEGQCETFILPRKKERTWGFYDFKGGQVLHRFHNEPDFKIYNPLAGLIRANSL